MRAGRLTAELDVTTRPIGPVRPHGDEGDELAAILVNDGRVHDDVVRMLPRDDSPERESAKKGT
jgi:hypothetical protein